VCHQQHIMQRPSKLPAVSLPGRPTFFVPQGWPDLPDCLLHSIVDRLGSFRDLLGFAATCPSWRSAFSSYPSKSTFLTKLPPLLIQPHIRAQGPLLPCTSGCRELYPCKVVDPANRNAALRCWIPQDTLEKMTFIGSSYGKLIYYCNGYCRIIDVFTGDEVATPRLPSHAGCSKLHLAGILTAPLASPNSHLLVSTESFLLDLHVGNDSWSELQLPCQFVIDHFVELDGQLIVSNSYGRSYALQLALSCMSPELWGGRSDIVYFARTARPWYLYRLCGRPDRLQDRPTRPTRVEPAGFGSTPVQSSVRPLWLYPSMFYSDGQ
uniref:F-box domain-containing protein n=1 Tax=Aegilops tauschii subsp. strangulata TaxID=200361 RepID=A0A453Q7Z9_AEGTS